MATDGTSEVEPAAEPLVAREDEDAAPPSFDFEAHRREALDSYLPVRNKYERLAQAVRAVLREALGGAGLKPHSIEARAKDADSFAAKASQPSEDDPSFPKYPTPLRDITDLGGVRVITFFLRDLETVTTVIGAEFDVLEATDMGAELIQQERFGYQSLHYLVKFSDKRTTLPEYSQYDGMVCEIQLRTVLQHAWAEIEHDIQYKSAVTTPSEIRRRFMSLAGLLEIADREFEAIHAADEAFRNAQLDSVSRGQLTEVEITASAVKAYLDRRLGADGRIADWSYESLARQLTVLGFTTLDQVDRAIREYDSDEISYQLWGNRQGQVTRFEGLLLAAMGQTYMERHPLRRESWWLDYKIRQLQRLKDLGVMVKDFDPVQDADTSAIV